MIIKDRIKFFRKLAQITNTSSTGTTQQSTVPLIDIKQVPGFRANLFSARPDLLNDINKIANILNTNMSKLSGGKVNFSMVYLNPSLAGDTFSNSVKNMYIISKWLYSVVSTQTTQYSPDALRAIGMGLVKMAQTYSFPEASNVQTDLINAGRSMIAKLGNGQG